MTTAREKTVAVCRAMLPDDANAAGNVHGGTLLKMIEEAGAIVSARHCNSCINEETRDSSFTVLVRVEHTDFLEPVYIGEVVEIYSQITYVSKHSVEVYVTVWAENILNVTRRLTNKALIWFVPISIKDPTKIMTVPPLTYLSKEEEEAGKLRYEKQRAIRWQANMNATMPDSVSLRTDVEEYTIEASRSCMMQMVGPAECAGNADFIRGGVLMKMMDTCAGIVAARHCKTNVVTASMDATNFHKKVPRGSMIIVSGEIQFSSSRSLEILVLVDIQEAFSDKASDRERAVEAFFNFVSLKGGKTIPVPPLKLKTDGDRRKFAEGKQRYELRRTERRTRKSSILSTSIPSDIQISGI